MDLQGDKIFYQGTLPCYLYHILICNYVLHIISIYIDIEYRYRCIGIDIPSKVYFMNLYSQLWIDIFQLYYTHVASAGFEHSES